MKLKLRRFTFKNVYSCRNVCAWTSRIFRISRESCSEHLFILNMAKVHLNGIRNFGLTTFKIFHALVLNKIALFLACDIKLT